MLSIKIFELGVFSVGEFIVGKNAWKYIKCPYNQMYFFYITIKKVYIEVPHWNNFLF